MFPPKSNQISLFSPVSKNENFKEYEANYFQ